MSVDLGAVVNGESATAEVVIENVGEVPVVVGRFKPGCSCMGVYRLEGLVKVAVSELVVAPGQKSSVFLDVQVAGKAGMSTATSLEFEEIPTSTTHSVVVTYTAVARLYAIPQHLSFGNLRPGEKIEQRIEVRSHGVESSGIPKIVSSNPSVLKYRWVEPTVELQRDFAREYPGQHLVGHVDLAWESPHEARALSESIRLEVNDGLSLTLLATAEVLEDVALLPGVLVLPKRTTNGQLMTARVVCRSRDGRPVLVKSVTSDSPRLTGSIEVATDPESGLLKVEYRAESDRSEAKHHRLTVVVDHGGDEKRLELPVTILPDFATANSSGR